KCIDRSNYLNLLPNLTYNSSKDKLKDFIKYQSNTSYSIEERMSPNAFENFLTGLKKQTFGKDKLNYISTINSSTSFSVAQIHVILKALSFDDEKLDAA